MSDEDKKAGRPKADFPTEAIRVPSVLIPTIKNLIEAFKESVQKSKEIVKNDD